MTFWSRVYLVLAASCLGLALLSRRPQIKAGGGIVAFAWVQSNFLALVHAPTNDFLYYFATDFVWTEVAAFMLLHRFSVWASVYWVSLVCQLMAHLWFWQFEPSPRRYHEVLNGFYWVQIIAVDVAAVLTMVRRPVKALPFKPRPRHVPPMVFLGDPRPTHRGPRLCPLIIRAYAG